MSYFAGTSASELIRGTQDADTIDGNGGNDTIVAGEDSLDGADLITTLEGSDLIFGCGGADTISSGAGNDIVVGGYGADLIKTGQGDDYVYANQDNDTIDAGFGNDTIIAGRGNDSVSAGEGNDLIFGNEGDDVIDGGAGIDIARFTGDRSGYSFVRNSDGSITSTDIDLSNGDEGTDVISNVELFVFGFGDGTYYTADGLLSPTSVNVPTPIDAKFNNANAEVGPNGLKADGTQPVGTGNQNEPFHVVEVHGGGANDLQIGVNTHIRQANDAHLYNEGFLQADGSVKYRAYGGPQTTATGSQSNVANRAGTVNDIFLSSDASALVSGGKTWNDYDARIDFTLRTNDGAVVNQTMLMSHADATGNYTPFASQGGFAGGLDDGAPNDNKTVNDSFQLAFFDTNPLMAGIQPVDFGKLPGGALDIHVSVTDRGGTTVLAESFNHIDYFAAGSSQIAYA